MIYKELYSNIENTTITHKKPDIEKATSNIYKSISIVAKRSNQINTALRSELHKKLEEFATPKDVLDEVLENKEQIEVSKYYESLPKSHIIAINEWLRNEIYFRDTGIENNS